MMGFSYTQEYSSMQEITIYLCQIKPVSYNANEAVKINKAGKGELVAIYTCSYIL